MHFHEVRDASEFKWPGWLLPPKTPNGLPEPFTSCRWDDYWQMRSSYTPKYIGYNYIIIGKMSRHATIEIFHNCAFAILHPNKWTLDKDKNIVWDKSEMLYFRLGCQHKWGAPLTPEESREVPRGRCIHSYKCTKCGHFEWVDSSD